ncbi:DUF4350 domain-containing protein [Spirosoma radiotolerans]|uniref:DUF4350 domain-containing protein n=1 Tax=Spirosoma radiotolerans TaxID=1379870 RepID=A0A0E3ZR54_9BACT|nr:DUF4350 domain-containing protein [Spirosoma radiotolerans]AKD53589.1 hypothetical protein SD10_00410 [Spirosoma radiotolerans]
MQKPNKYLLILLVTITAYVLFEYYRPKPIDWRATYENDDKIPFGTQALFELLPDVIQPSAIRTVRLPVYTLLTETKLPTPSNYIAVCREFDVDKNDREQLLTFVRRGNNAFISAYEFPDSLGITLGFRADVKDESKADSTLRQNFVNPSLRKTAGYNFVHDDGRNFLTIKQPAHITVLGRNARKEPVFIRIQYGKGHFFIHNLPLAFTNYYVLDPKTSDYAFKALAYLPARPTYWDEYQKQGRFSEDEQSIFRYIHSQPALNWAYYLVAFGLIFYVIFAGKRTQRIIPVIEAPKNTSVDFVQTIGRMYFQQGDHENLARKKIQYFLADLRERYGLTTTSLDKEFTETLARKSGAPLDETADLVRLLRDAQKSISLSEYDLITLNRAIENFKQAI